MSNRKHRDNQEICARKVRELAQSGINKHCFECGQPGVTYIDITVGCFVCTSCSGMLRGLNPPHRVKSISMTTFSQQEVEFLQNHGNEVGKRTWLCAFDPKTDGCFDARDAQRLKEFLQDKYEKKKWHFSKNKNRREVEGPWSPGAQVLPSPHPTAPSTSHPLPPSARPTRTLSQSQLSSWDRAPSVSPADHRTDVFTARPSRSQSFRDPPIKDSIVCGLERQRPSTVSPGMGPQSNAPSFPALPRPSASSTFKNSFTLGRSVSSVGGPAPFRAFPKSLSVDFGGLSQQHPVPSPTPPVPHSQDRYAALSQLDSVFSESSGTVPLVWQIQCPAPKAFQRSPIHLTPPPVHSLPFLPATPSAARPQASASAVLGLGLYGTPVSLSPLPLPSSPRPQPFQPPAPKVHSQHHQTPTKKRMALRPSLPQNPSQEQLHLYPSTPSLGLCIPAEGPHETLSSDIEGPPHRPIVLPTHLTVEGMFGCHFNTS
ncbi:hypothetical protein JZ751_006689 [Albula glossodonta]|uniref:Arf-GAP domain-containing protein n=1 Tax=Albula glossodonta TaxID=121402 RepID=A0A8T2PA36_9TELE|nr:hypothetical protein JZ751_006689 [Albula glossodonta]